VRAAKRWTATSNAREFEKEIVETDACITEVQTEVHRMLPGDPARADARAGLAFDFHANAIKADEAVAVAGRAGAWAGTFKPPWVQKGQTYCCTNEFPRSFAIKDLLVAHKMRPGWPWRAVRAPIDRAIVIAAHRGPARSSCAVNRRFPARVPQSAQKIRPGCTGGTVRALIDRAVREIGCRRAAARVRSRG
jgi:hypothetical protein